MKKCLFATVSLFALAAAGPAVATDMIVPTKAPVYSKAPYAAAIYDWSGFYVGLNGGGGYSSNCWDFVADTAPSHDPTDSRYTTAATVGLPDGCHNGSGATFGGQLGYRWQTSNWVFGAEAQGNWSDISGSIHSLRNFAYVKNSKIDSFALFTGQVGYALNNVLLYVKGGGALVGEKLGFNGTDNNDKNNPKPDNASKALTRWGATVGAGFELGLSDNWTVGAEYDHIFLSQEQTEIVSSLRRTTVRVREGLDVGMVRLSYKFGGNGRSGYGSAGAVSSLHDWSGLYMGVNGGGGASSDCWNLRRFTNPYAGKNTDGSSDPTSASNATGNEGCNTATGGTFGGQVGYRWQSANLVYGIEAQGNWASISGSNISNVLNTDNFGFPTYKQEHHNRATLTSFALLTGQVGYTAGNALVYVKGGAAVVGRTFEENRVPHNSAFDAGKLAGYAEDTSWGGTLGAGLEVGLAPNWSVGAEYDRIFLGSRTVDLSNTAGGGGLYKTDNIRQDVDIGLVRLNYKLGGPVMAKQ